MIYHSEYLMNMKKPTKGAALGIGMNYIRFAIEEKSKKSKYRAFAQKD